MSQQLVCLNSYFGFPFLKAPLSNKINELKKEFEKIKAFV